MLRETMAVAAKLAAPFLPSRSARCRVRTLVAKVVPLKLVVQRGHGVVDLLGGRRKEADHGERTARQG